MREREKVDAEVKGELKLNLKIVYNVRDIMSPQCH